MKTTISKMFFFDASHVLPNLPAGHKCRRLHGHTYRVEVKCAGSLDERGFIVDYAEIADAWQPVHDQIDHRHLNEIDGLENPTTEILASWIFQRLFSVLPSLVAVRVYESSTTWCEVTR